MNYRSKLEQTVANTLEKQGITYLYEAEKYDYVTRSRYTPDFFLKNGVILEVKGFFAPSDRRKMIAVKEQHPELDIRLVFQRNNTLTKKSKTTYGAWAEKHGFLWCIWPHIPTDWLQNEVN